MGNKMERNNWQNRWMGGLAMGECEDRQIKSCIIETNCKHSEGGLEDYHWVMFTHAMDFF